MSQTVTLSAQNSVYNGTGKPYVAVLTGLDRKFGFRREFMPRTAHVTEAGLYEVCNYDKKDRKDITIYFVVAIDGGLEKIVIREETAVELLKDGRALTEIAASKREDLERLLAQYVKAEDISLTQREFLQAIIQRIQTDL